MWKAEVKILDVQFQEGENELQTRQEKHKLDYLQLQQRCRYIPFIVINTLFLIDSQITRVISSPIQGIPRVTLCRVKKKKEKINRDNAGKKINKIKDTMQTREKANNIQISQFLQTQRNCYEKLILFHIWTSDAPIMHSVRKKIIMTRIFIGSKSFNCSPKYDCSIQTRGIGSYLIIQIHE